MKNHATKNYIIKVEATCKYNLNINKYAKPALQLYNKNQLVTEILVINQTFLKMNRNSKVVVL